MVSDNSNESLSDRLDRPVALPWRPTKGDKLMGIVVGRETRSSQYGDYEAITIRDDADGVNKCWHAFHTVSKTEVAKQNPQVDDRIGLKYCGKSGEQGYEMYVVIVDHATPNSLTGLDAEPNQNAPVTNPTVRGTGREVTVTSDDDEF